MQKRRAAMANKHSAQWQFGDDRLHDGKGARSIPETVKPPQAAQQSSEAAHELSDDQMQSIVGGLGRLQVIRIIGFEN
jgi:bacteriocin-like protein